MLTKQQTREAYRQKIAKRVPDLPKPLMDMSENAYIAGYTTALSDVLTILGHQGDLGICVQTLNVGIRHFLSEQ